MNARPSFEELTPIEQLHFGNGVGPNWLPSGLRNFITGAASWFFQDASWRHHDFGYVIGGDRWDRARCDWKFFTHMIGDALSQPKWMILRIPAALVISVLFYVAVRLFGQFGSFSYRKNYADLATVRSYISNQKGTKND